MYKTDIKDMNIEAEEISALSVYQLDYSSVDNSTLQCCVVHDGASDDRADKCSISGYYHHRKRHLALHTTTTDKQCKYDRLIVGIGQKSCGFQKFYTLKSTMQ